MGDFSSTFWGSVLDAQNIDFLGVETGVHALLSTFGGFGWGLRKSYAFSLSNLGSFSGVFWGILRGF